MEKEIEKHLSIIQTQLKAPKGQFNKFGNYSYRSCEDILEAVKPLLNGAVLTLTDSIELIGERYYIKATAALLFNGEQISVSAYARESLDKKGMDSAQITGSTSSYARKYALNGLFCIDDTKDADSTNTHDKFPVQKDRHPPIPVNNGNTYNDKQSAAYKEKGEVVQTITKLCGELTNGQPLEEKAQFLTNVVGVNTIRELYRMPMGDLKEKLSKLRELKW